MTTFARELTAAEVLAHYTSTKEYTSGGDGYGQRVNAIPWAWFDQGDDILDNDYVTGSSLWNWAIAGGIPGGVPAKTEWQLEVNDANFATDEAMYLSCQPIPYGADYTKVDNLINSIAAPATITTGATVYYANLYFAEQLDSNYYVYVRLIDAGSDLQVQKRWRPASTANTVAIGDYEDIVPHASTYKSFLYGPVFTPYTKFSPDLVLERADVGLAFKRTTGSANITVDYLTIIRDPIKIFFDITMNLRSFVLVNKDCYAVTTATGTVEGIPAVTGPAQEMTPDNANYFFNAVGNHAIANVTTRTVGYKIFVTPRWSVL